MKIIIPVLLMIMLSCKTEEEKTSVLGSWNCDAISENGQQKYQVSIVHNYLYPDSTNLYIINNFNNSGITEDKEVYVRDDGKGNLIITGTASLGISYSGKGVVTPDFSAIDWKYQVNDGINNPWVTAHYY